jgi:hypothetical protein
MAVRVQLPSWVRKLREIGAFFFYFSAFMLLILADGLIEISPNDIKGSVIFQSEPIILFFLFFFLLFYNLTRFT